MIELFANYRINNPRSSGDVSNGNEGKLKCMVNKHFPVFFQARILPGNWELPALMDTLAGAGWRLLKENLRCAAERFFTHERREPSVPRRGRRKSTVNKHFHRFFCRLPFAWKGREPAPHLMAVSFHPWYLVRTSVSCKSFRGQKPCNIRLNSKNQHNMP